MKNLKYIFILILAISSGLSDKAFAQSNILTQTPTLSSGPYAGGTLITIGYSMEFLMLTGNQAQLEITFPGHLLDFVSSDLTSSGIWTLSSTTNNQRIYQTATFSPADNNYTSATNFTLTFRVISNNCNAQSDEIITTLSTLTGGVPSNQVTVSKAIDIQNSGTGVSVDMSLLQGDECSLAMYEINSFGLDINTSSGNSYFDLTLPAGATLRGVFNTLGLPVAFTTSGTTYSWYRSGISNENAQQHFVLIEFDQAVLCASGGSNYQMNLVFNSHNVCPHSPSIPATYIYGFTACCNQTPCNLNGVVLRKSLIKHPLRYFPDPDNCKTHDYIIKVDNLTSNNLTNFELTDFLDDIIPGSFLNEIEVTQISASLNSIIPGTLFEFDSYLGSNYNLGLILSSGGSIVIFPVGGGNYLNSNFIIESFEFPKFSTLTVKIKHRLGADPPSTYNNEAKLHFRVGTNSYTGNVFLESVKDTFEPYIVIEKKVRNALSSGPFRNNVIASPDDDLEFRIKIKNYGMKEVTGVDLTDVISEIFPNGGLQTNFSYPASLSVTGTGYSAAEIALLQTDLNSTLSSGGFGVGSFTIKAAPCNGYTELVITYQTSVEPIVTCNSIYTNTATLNYTFNNSPVITSDSAKVNVDLFKNIAYKLVASCEGPSGPWSVDSINGIPGKPIWYKASLRNNNNYTVSDLKMMIQLPSQTYLSSNQGPINLVSSAPSTPTGTNLHPEAGSIISNDFIPVSATITATNGWLNGTSGLPISTPPGDVAIYKVIPSLGAWAETSIIYKVMVPINTLGAQYKTTLGVSRSLSDRCPIVKRSALILKVASINNCDTLIDCDLIMFDSKVERDLSNSLRYNFTLSNMINNYNGFNIDNFDIVAHQPFTNIVTLSPYNRQMIGYRLDAISSSQPPFTFPLGTPVGNGRRYHEVNSNNPTLGFGNVNFDIKISANPPQGSTNITFPVNIIFRDSADSCTFCEKTIFLDYKLPIFPPWFHLIKKGMLKSEKDPVNLSLNSARKRLQKSPSGAKIEQWYEDLKKNGGISKMLLKRSSDIIELFKIARKTIENDGVLEQKDFDLIVKTMKYLNEISPAPKGLINNSTKQLKSLIGKKWSMSIFDRWGQ